jgi:alkylated DNA repair dioxygenase AlkB
MALDIPADVGTLTLVEDFITEAEERTLVGHIIQNLPNGTTRKKVRTRNVIQRWGVPIPYRNDFQSTVIPAHFQFLLDRLVAQNHVPLRPDSISMNQYLKHQSILAHIDLPEGGSVVTVLSLVTPATMIFRRNNRAFTVDLPPRSLVQMRDEIRYNWTHEISPVADTRYSLVFRCSQETEQV